MPLDGNQLDELLSGFIDGQLTEAERQQVEQAISHDSRIADQVERLRRQSASLRSLGDALLTQAKPGLTSKPNRIIELARQRAEAMELPRNHHVRSSKPLPASIQLGNEATTKELASRALHEVRGSTWKRWLALSTVAATLLLFAVLGRQAHNVTSVTHQKPANDHERASRLDSTAEIASSTPESGASQPAFPTVVAPHEADLPPSDSTSTVKSSLVSQLDSMSYVLVVDVQVTAQALRDGAIDKLFVESGIPVVPAVAADREILKALDDSRLVVRGESVAGAVFVHVVRGDMQELDVALRKLWQDPARFPNVNLNLSIDARATLAREILRSLGDRYTVTDRFAVPLVSSVANDATREAAPTAAVNSAQPVAGSSPFPGNPNGERYISSSQRAQGWAQGWAELPIVPNQDSQNVSEKLVTILLVLHRVD
jgi:anti-sigma factor RsiW